MLFRSGVLVRKCKLSFLSLRDWGCFWRSFRCFVPSSRSSIAVKTAAKRRACAGSSPDNPHVIGFFGRRGNRPFLASGNRSADGLTWCYRKPLTRRGGSTSTRWALHVKVALQCAIRPSPSPIFLQCDSGWYVVSFCCSIPKLLLLFPERVFLPDTG